jgi:hypothetical protein
LFTNIFGERAVLWTVNIKRHAAYLRYLVRHKYYVYKYGRLAGVGFFRSLFHDWTKFLPCEWFPYAECFYEPDGSSRYAEGEKFVEAWNHHQKHNPHHWQYWIMTMDRGNEVILPMPMKYVREMVADWIGAGIAITGKFDVVDWYSSHRDNMRMHMGTVVKIYEVFHYLRSRGVPV